MVGVWDSGFVILAHLGAGCVVFFARPGTYKRLGSSVEFCAMGCLSIWVSRHDVLIWTARLMNFHGRN